MKFSDAIKPISFLKTHASEIIRDISSNNKTMIITHNGEAKVVIQDIKVYEQLQESLAFLKLLALSNDSINKGNYSEIDKSFHKLDKRINSYKSSK